ncbi:MAG TPA: cbb3-type cytochrome c oxidase subunit I [Candidatus Polarisedimenticolia bacterium]|nr:cbb3-type cytochrome c oxidase subunit I [Candidatus Polarisedimenticolia bacterium]
MSEHKTPFIRKYIFSTDHKVIGIQFLFVSLFFMVVGGILALMVRWQLGYPDKAMPLGTLLPENLAPEGHIGPEFYNALFTMHGSIMIFLVIIPLLTGAFGNFLIPLMIGARDMAFPRLNMLSFWVALPGGLVMASSFFTATGTAATGWTAYPPLSAVPDYTGVTIGQTLWIIAVLIVGTGSIMGAVNYITTIVNMRAPGMHLFRMPLSVWALFITAILQLMATPVLASAMGMLLLDRTLGTHFFAPSGGGQVLLWQHLFWFYSHPAVYIMILPAMGFVSDILATFARKPIFGYKAMVFSIMGIAGLGFIVWGHHMFQSGMNPALGTAFMLSTMVIAVPSAIKTFNWLGTLWRGSIQFSTAMLNAMSFVSMFIIGGLSGIFMASTPVDIFIHDTYFIVAHLHYVLFGGSLFGIFAAITYWFPKMFGRMMNETLGRVHWALTFVLFNCVFFPMHILGMGGHMRRIYDPTQYEFLKPLQPINVFITNSALLLGLVQLLFVANFFWSLFAGKKAERNPWRANSLEWSAPSPPPHGNFERIPTVYRGPYEFSHPDMADDYLPQDSPVQVPHPSRPGVMSPARA